MIVVEASAALEVPSGRNPDFRAGEALRQFGMVDPWRHARLVDGPVKAGLPPDGWRSKE